MPEHYTKNTETATAYCKRCGRFTDHRIDDGRRGPCIDPNHPRPLPRAQIPPLDPGNDEQLNLFAKGNQE